MSLDSGINPSQRAELFVEADTRSHRRRDAPPPYSVATRDDVVTDQPVIHQTIIVQAPLKNGPTYYNCPVCQERVLTRVKYESSNKTHLIAGFVCGFTTWCCLCCLAAIPYLVSTCKKTEHYCPHCDTMLGSYSKL